MNLTNKKRRRLLEKSDGREWCMGTKWREQIVKMCYWLLEVYHDSSQQVSVSTHVQVCGFTFVYLHLWIFASYKCRHSVQRCLLVQPSRLQASPPHKPHQTFYSNSTSISWRIFLSQTSSDSDKWMLRKYVPPHNMIVYYSLLKKQPH